MNKEKLKIGKLKKEEKEKIDKTEKAIFEQKKYEYLYKFFTTGRNKSIYTYWKKLVEFLGRIKNKPLVGWKYNYLTYDMIKRYTNVSTYISEKTNTLAYLGLIDKLNVYDSYNKDIPIVKRTRKKQITFLAFPKLTIKDLKEADARAKKLLDNKYTLKAFNKSFLADIESEQLANTIIQDNEGTYHLREEQKEKITNIILTTVEEKEYIPKMELKEIVLKKMCTNKKMKSNIEYHYKMAINKLIAEQKIYCRPLKKKEIEKLGKDPKDKRIYIIKEGVKFE